ncbi:MAG TPA: ABC transporter permease [Firmicutes bacterium]|nr:ABC transporter permease [Bacillota bacterium]
MREFMIRRFLYLIPTLILISIVSFIIINLPPGDYLTARIAELEMAGDTTSRQYLEQLKTYYGLDRPVYVQYIKWVTRFVRGDFGISFEYNKPVKDLIKERLALTILLSLSTMVFTWVVAVPIGIYSATHQHSFLDRFFTFISFAGMATPGFLLALVIMVLVLMRFNQSLIGLFSPQYVNAPWDLAKFIDMLKHLWLPVVLIGFSGTAGLIRITRGNLLDVLGQQYILTARAKGLKEAMVIYKHAMRIAINPLISIAGMSLPGIIGGEMLTSIVLNLPTTGPLFYRALQVQDMFLAGSFLMFLVVFLVIGNFLADLALAWADPRIRYE